MEPFSWDHKFGDPAAEGTLWEPGEDQVTSALVLDVTQ